MEGRMCKICNKVFSNGRALGGHMRSHLVTLPIPWKKPTQLDSSSSSASFSCDEEEDKTTLTYGLRENPRRSVRMADPEFQEDRESETTRKKNPTRKRSKRVRVTRLVKEPSSSTELEPEPVMSSVSHQISAEEDVALCLMMLSRDVWSFIDSYRSRYKCETCHRVFDSFQALGGHKTSHRNYLHLAASNRSRNRKKNVVQDEEKLHECPFCYRVFGSGQALGGHKRSHVLGNSSTTASDHSLGGKGDDSVNLVNPTKVQGNLVTIDLNLPAPPEDEEECSAVSDDAEYYQSPLHL